MLQEPLKYDTALLPDKTTPGQDGPRRQADQPHRALESGTNNHLRFSFVSFPAPRADPRAKDGRACGRAYIHTAQGCYAITSRNLRGQERVTIAFAVLGD